MGKIGLAAAHHPWKVDTLVNLRGEPDDFRVVVEILAPCENTHQKNGGVDGGDFAFPAPLTGCDIHKVIEPAMFPRRLFVEIFECGEHPLARHGVADPAM